MSAISTMLLNQLVGLLIYLSSQPHELVCFIFFQKFFFPPKVGGVYIQKNL